MKLLFMVLCDIEGLAGYISISVGESVEWAALISSAEENRLNYSKALNGKTFFNALYGTYIVTII